MATNLQNEEPILYEAPKAATAERHEALLAAIVESTDDAIVSKDLNGMILSWNDAAERMFGYAAPEIIGQNVRRLIPDELQYEEAQILANIRTGKRISHYETMRLRKNGERFEVSITVSPLVDHEGRIIGASKIAREITHRKLLEKQLIESEKLAATGRMAAAVAHEVNNPLESVLNLLYLARTTRSLSEVHSYLGTAEGELERVAHIARQTLGFYRDDGTPTRVMVQGLLEKVLAVYQGKLKSAGIAIECRFDSHPPLVASSGELIQIFSNLIANAIDAMPRGGVLRIQTKRRLDPDGVEIQVADNGIGVPKEHLHKVFEPFFTTKGSLGTGIGLWVVKQLVEKAGGQVTLTSKTERASRGTTVSIVLPLADSSEASAVN